MEKPFGSLRVPYQHVTTNSNGIVRILLIILPNSIYKALAPRPIDLRNQEILAVELDGLLARTNGIGIAKVGIWLQLISRRYRICVLCQ